MTAPAPFPLSNGVIFYRLAPTRRAIALTLLAVLAAASFLIPAVNRAFAASPVVRLDAMLTKTADGQAPFSPVDTSSNNGIVATLDNAQYTFDINVNTLDAQTHTLSEITIVGKISSTSSGVKWLAGSLPAACTGRSVSSDGKTLTCRITSPTKTGTALNVSASWYGGSDVVHNTDVATSFTVSGKMKPDASNGSDPSPATSNTDNLKVVSTGSSAEVRKVVGDPENLPYTINRDSTGAPISVDVKWGVQVEVKSPTPGLTKGVNATNLSTLSLSDLLGTGAADHALINKNALLVSCAPVVTADSGLANSKADTSYKANTVQDSGTWTCAQSGGAGKDITINASGTVWSPGWYPFGKTYSRDNYWSFATGTHADEVYNSPAGRNNQAVVATQMVTVRYPYADIIAFDQTAGDRDKSTASTVKWCNTIGNISVTGATSSDDASNNEACISLNYGTGIGKNVAKTFARYGQNRMGVEPEGELGLTQGSLGTGSSDNYLVNGQKFAIGFSAEPSPLSVHGLTNWISCDAIDTTTYNVIAHKSGPFTGGYTGTAHDYYTWQMIGTPASGFPALTDNDIVVEFASTGGTFATTTAQRKVNCDNPSLSWEEDPHDVPGGITAANLVRMRVLKTIPTGIRLETYVSVQAKNGLADRTRVYNFMQYKASNAFNGVWQTANDNCLPEKDPWNASSGLYSCKQQADRALIILAPSHTRISDTPATSDNDLMEQVNLGGNWTYTVSSGMAFNVDTHVEGVHVYNVLPPGLEYASSTVAPSRIIKDCDASINQNCLTSASARTNIGSTTLVWDRGDFYFSYSGSNHEPQLKPDLFGKWQVTTHVASFIPNGATLQTRAWTEADQGLEQLNHPMPYRNTTTGHNDNYSGPTDDDWVTVATAQAFGIEKYITNEKIDLDGTLEFSLAFGNLTGQAKVMDAIDILPYNGDQRSPASAFTGGYRLSDFSDPSSLIDKVYVTSADPSTINSDPNANPGAGTGIWSCTYDKLGDAGCPTSDEVTAIRLVSQSLGQGAYGLVQVELQTFGNEGDDVYTNRFHARASTLALPVMSSDVHAVTPHVDPPETTTTLPVTTTTPVQVGGESIVRTLTDVLPFTGAARVGFVLTVALSLLGAGCALRKSARKKHA